MTPRMVLLIAHRIFLYHWMTVLLEAQSKFGTSKELSRRISQIKKNMLVGFHQTLSCSIGSILIDIICNSFTKLLKFRFYRSNMNRIEKAAYHILNFGRKKCIS